MKINLFLLLLQAVKEKHGKEVEDAHDLEILRSQWEKAKQKLSRIPEVRIATFLPGVQEDFRESVKRSDFEEQCEDLFKTIIEELKKTLEGAKVRHLF